jgi:hypothetical protein
MSEMSVDRTAVREMVEDFWRSFILFMRDLQAKYPRASRSEFPMNECMEFSRHAWSRFEAIAALMPPEQGKAFMQMIDEEDDICSKEHHFRPEALYRRLNLSIRAGNKRDQDAAYRRLGLDPAAIDAAIASGDATRAGADVMARMQSQPQRAAPTHRRQGIGEMAVRTAVRATVWEVIRSLFRL